MERSEQPDESQELGRLRAENAALRRDGHDAEERIVVLEGEATVRGMNFGIALASRDVIGQAKGIIMASLGCTADEAFERLKDQSQHQNRKLREVAEELVRRSQHPPADSGR